MSRSTAIPPEHREDEFSLQLSWTPRVNGVKAPTPGFYLRAAFANEGFATGVVKGSWDNGRGGNGSLVSGDFLIELLSLIAEHGYIEPRYNPATSTADLGAVLAKHTEEAQEGALRAKRARLDALRAEVAELEAALES